MARSCVPVCVLSLPSLGDLKKTKNNIFISFLNIIVSPVAMAEYYKPPATEEDEPDPELVFKHLCNRLSYQQFKDLYEKNKKETIEITEDILLDVKGDYWNTRCIVTIREKGKPNKVVKVSMQNFYWTFGQIPTSGRR